VKVILPLTCQYDTDVNTTSAGGDGGAPTPAGARSASRTAVVVVVVVVVVVAVVSVAQEHHHEQGEAGVSQRGIENSREYNRSKTLEKSLLDRGSLYGNKYKLVLNLQHSTLRVAPC
jgi:hypothetical protein